jgi:hypothetical protein
MITVMSHHGRWTLVGVAICAATTGVLAQATPAQRPAQPPAAQRPAAAPAASTPRFVVIGCVARQAQPATAAGRGSSTAARFTITDRRGDRPTTYRLQGDPKEFDLHVGHWMEVAGTLSSQPAGAAAAPPTLNVTSMTWISTTCPKR